MLRRSLKETLMKNEPLLRKKKYLKEYKNIIYLFEIKTGDIFGVRSFFTEEKREFSVVSKNFSTIFEINKHDFLAEIKKNPLDYVIYIENLLFLTKF